MTGALQGNTVSDLRGGLGSREPSGQIRSGSIDDIACWFTDTNYDGDSLFVRHADFTGADEPYEKLKRALKAESDEAAWATLCSSTSHHFVRPISGKMPVEVIDRYGDELLIAKAYEVGQ